MYKLQNLSIICNTYTIRVTGKLESVSADFGWEAGYTMCWLIYHRAMAETNYYSQHVYTAQNGSSEMPGSNPESCVAHDLYAF